MIVTCPSCAKRHHVDPAWIGAQGRKVRCARCRRVWHALPPLDMPVDLPPAQEPQTPPAPAEAIGLTQAPEPHGADASASVSDAAEAPPQIAASAPTPGDPASVAPAYQAAPTHSAPSGGSVWGMVGWFSLALLMLVAAGLVVARHEVVRLFPASASAYAKVGLPVEPTQQALRLANVTAVPTDGTGIRLAGEIVNPTDAPQALLPLDVLLLDADAQQVWQDVVTMEQQQLAPGASVPFETEISQPPADAATFSVTMREPDAAEVVTTPTAAVP